MNLKSYYYEEYSRSISKLILKKPKVKRKALFIDRDGVLIKDVNYIKSVEEVELCLNVLSFLEEADNLGYSTIVVTNQSSVSRGIITYDNYLEITSRFLSHLPLNLYPEFILSSFHLPNNTNNLDDFPWRKPGTGMFDYVLKHKKYDLTKSIMIGDKLSDLIPARKIGIDNIFFIESSLHKFKESKLVKEWSKKNKISVNRIKELDANYL